MGSKEAIISKIKGLRQDEKPLPNLPVFEHPADLTAKFARSLESNHAQVVTTNDLKASLAALAGHSKSFVSLLPELASPLDINSISHPAELKGVEMGIIRGAFGVAENGAIWIPEELMKVRALPFIVVHLVVVVSPADLVGDMHAAYKRLGQAPGFGVFIAGPSKTADIEQSLVIGAHGPKKMTVVLG